MSPSDPKRAQPGDQDALVIPLTVDERERLNEWAAEIDVPVTELARRLILRYLAPLPAERDLVDERSGRPCSPARARWATSPRTPRSSCVA